MTWAAHGVAAHGGSTLERAYALARSGMCTCIADLKDRLIREGHGALEVLGLLSAMPVARDLGQVMARSCPPRSSMTG
jgi:hypothetical protein